MRPREATKLHLEDLLDLELYLQADREADHEMIRARDAAIGHEVGAHQLQDRELFLEWLARRRGDPDSAQPPPGHHVVLLLQTVGIALAVTGFMIGAGTVSGWLRYDPTIPVNSIFFFSTLVGTQMLLLMLWLFATLPATLVQRLPGMEALHFALRSLGKIPPMIMGSLISRLSVDNRLNVQKVIALSRKWNWVYGDLTFWKLIFLTQVFAITFNLGAILSLLGIPYLTDPAFGWKARILEPPALHRIVQMLAIPFGSFIPSAVPSLETVQDARYTSVGERFEKRDQGGKSRTPYDRWSGLWPFLLASLVTYGLFPRFLTLGFSHWRSKRALESVNLDHGEFFDLRDRLRRPFVTTTHESGKGFDAADAPLPVPAAGKVTQETAPTAQETASPPLRTTPSPVTGGTFPLKATCPPLETGPHPPGPTLEPAVRPDLATSPEKVPATPQPREPEGQIIRWAGVDVNPDKLKDMVIKRLGKKAEAVLTVGELDVAQDEAALAAVSARGTPPDVYMIVESWEPPTADYADFIEELRGRLGPRRMIIVLLYNQSESGAPVPARDSDERVWKEHLSLLADPHLSVLPFVLGADGG